MLIGKAYENINILRFETYESGQIKAANVKGKQVIETEIGELIPKDFTNSKEDKRGKDTGYAMSFYENGQLKKIMLQDQTQIKTPIGMIKAELITFYPEGSINRVFPLNGKVDGYWTEEDEKEMADTYTFNLSDHVFTIKLMGLRFYPKGQLKNILMWPNEIIDIESPIGEMAIRQGVSFYETGNIESVEPAVPVYIYTPIGYVEAYDSNAIGIHADSNSLKFNEQGEVIAVTTEDCGIVVTSKNGMKMVYKPREVPSILDNTETMILPLHIRFTGDEVVLDDGVEHRFSQKQDSFRIVKMNLIKSACSGGCSSCSGCGQR